MIRIDHLSFAYHKGKTVLKDVTFEIEQGKVIAVLGKNGIGKSTLLSCIANGVDGVFEDDAPLNKMSLKERAKRINYVPQLSFAQSLTVYETISLGRIPYYLFRPSKLDKEIIDQTIASLGLESIVLSPLEEISGGERQKTLLGVGLAANSDILLLDEPTNNLDVEAKANLFKIIVEKVKTLQKTVIFSTHDLSIAHQYADAFLLLHEDGSVLYLEKKDLTEEHLKRLYGDAIKIVQHEGNTFVSYN